jgi:hypothetical protein
MKFLKFNILTMIRISALVAIVALMWTGGATTTQASVSTSLKVIATRDNNSPLSGVSVCVAPATGAQVAGKTDLAGQVTFDSVNSGQVSITVSCPGFVGQTHTSTLPDAGGTARFILVAGAGGPSCNVPASPPSKIPPTLAITSFDWHLNRRTPLFFETVLNLSATMTPGGPVIPTHYRVGETSDLSSVAWTAYTTGVITFRLGYNGDTLTGYGQRTLFMQVKANDVTSAVVSKTVNLQPLQVREYRFDEATLQELLNVVAATGFRLTTNTTLVTQNHCASAALNGLGIEIPSGYLPDRAWEKIVQVRLGESGQKKFTDGWRVKSIDIASSSQVPPDTARTVAGQADGDGFAVVIHLSTGPRSLGADNPCFQNTFPLRAIVLEGPADDMALDQAKRWKNMFPQH